MITKTGLPGVKIYKSFRDFIKDLSSSLEKEHALVHKSNKLSTAELVKKNSIKVK
jgi:hypothetical protein